MKSLKKNSIMFTAGLLIFLLLNISHSATDSDIEIKPMGNFSLEHGQIMNGHNNFTGDLENVWMNKLFLGFGLQALVSPKDTIRGGVEIKMYNEFPRQVELTPTRRLYYYAYLTEAQYKRRWLQGDRLGISSGIGLFPFKYNGNARNLGEYLFRSTTYPQTLDTEFDFPFARLLGFNLSADVLFSFFTLHNNLLITSKVEWYAIHDVDLSYLVNLNASEMFAVGAGVSFSSLISADPEFTTPESERTAYLDEDTGDTLHYTFSGTKLMAQASVDPKKFFSDDNFGGLMGQEDLKFYVEAAMLGVKNYPQALKSPIWYMSRLERIPVMFGFNFPGFNILDVISLEAEWWGNKYANDKKGIVKDQVPLPFLEGNEVVVDSNVYKNDNWKWSMYAKKTFANHLQITFQVASDHMRTFALDWSRQDWEESLRKPEHWYYVIKFGAFF